MIRAVLDTNVLASSIAGVSLPTSTPGVLLRAWRRGEFDLIVSDHILSELERTLGTPYFQRRISPVQRERVLAVLRLRGELTAITTNVSGVAAHPEDDLILAAAVSARAEYLVTGDGQFQRLYRYQGVTILPPRAFLARLHQAA